MTPYKFQLTKKSKISQEFHLLTFKNSSKRKFVYYPGQYISIKINDKVNRSYSIYNSLMDNTIQILFDTRPNGIGVQYLKSLNINDAIEIIGPLGHFTLPDNLSNNLLFLSTGSGISPINSMIDYLVDTKRYKNHNIILCFGTRYKRNIIFYNKYNDYKKRKYIGSYNIYLSKENINKIAGKYVTDYIIGADKNVLQNSDIFICGNTNMITDCLKLLNDKNISEAKIHFEKFY